MKVKIFLLSLIISWLLFHLCPYHAYPAKPGSYEWVKEEQNRHQVQQKLDKINFDKRMKEVEDHINKKD